MQMPPNTGNGWQWNPGQHGTPPGPHSMLAVPQLPGAKHVPWASGGRLKFRAHVESSQQPMSEDASHIEKQH